MQLPESIGLWTVIFSVSFALLDKVKLKISWKSAIATFIIVSTIAVLSGQGIEQTETFNTVYYYFFAVYTILVLCMIAYSVLRLSTSNDVVSWLFIAVVLVMFLSDFLYASNNYVNYILSLAIVSFIAQFISYFLMVEYINRKLPIKIYEDKY